MSRRLRRKQPSDTSYCCSAIARKVGLRVTTAPHGCAARRMPKGERALTDSIRSKPPIPPPIIL